MEKIVTGYCPTQKCEYSISVKYSAVSNHYLQVGARCEYILGNFDRCPIYKECPIRASAPRETND